MWTLFYFIFSKCFDKEILELNERKKNILIINKWRERHELQQWERIMKFVAVYWERITNRNRRTDVNCFNEKSSTDIDDFLRFVVDEREYFDQLDLRAHRVNWIQIRNNGHYFLPSWSRISDVHFPFVSNQLDWSMSFFSLVFDQFDDDLSFRSFLF